LDATEGALTLAATPGPPNRPTPAVAHSATTRKGCRMSLRKDREATRRDCEEGVLGRVAYWIIAKRDGGHMRLLTIALDGSGEALPVFGFEEEAEMFLWLEGLDSGWRVRETSSGELVSLLYGSYARVGLVALDPLPPGAEPGDGAAMHSTSVGRGEFVETLMRT
jgi:hypothetical protein